MTAPVDDRPRKTHPMSRISAPFGLAERIRKPDMGIDAAALGTVLLIALMLGLLVGSRFVYAPGVTVDFTSDGKPASLNLPAAAPGVRLAGAMTSETLTVLSPSFLALKQDDMAIWNGRILKLDELEKEFAAKPRRPGEVLLLKADKAVSMQAFFRIIGLAKKAGFTSVQIAGEDARDRNDPRK